MSKPHMVSSRLGRLRLTTVAIVGVALVGIVASATVGAGPFAGASPAAPTPGEGATPPVPSPFATVEPSPSEATPQIASGSLARVMAPAAVLDEPNGLQWALIEPGHDVLGIDTVSRSGTDWHRIEFEYCCSPGQPWDEWVFGWVAADLETAGVAGPGLGIDAPEMLEGPTLEAVDWACPGEPEGLYRIPEPVRHLCYRYEIVTIRGVVTRSDQGEALYPGDPAFLTAAPNVALAPTGMESGFPVLPLHLPTGDPLLLAWLNDDRVKAGEEVEVTGGFAPGAVVCTQAPRLPELPPMTPDEQQLWCEQQFGVGSIHGDGPDPIVEAPLAEPLWTPPPGVQPSSGEGWRLLASATRNQLAVTVASETVEAALDEAEYLRLWLSMARGEMPPVDFAREFVVRFVPPVSSSCPWIAFTGIGVDPDAAVMFGRFEDLSAALFLGAVPENFGCTTDAAPHAFLVVVDRALAPASEFRLRLRDERLCEECGITGDETVVRLDE